MGGKGSGPRKRTPDVAEPIENEQEQDEQEGKAEEEYSEDYAAVSVTRPPEREKKSISQNVMDALGLGKKPVVQPLVKATRKAATSRKSRSGKELSTDFVAALVPMLALGIAVYVRMRIKEEKYKKVAPQTDELSKVLTPLARIMARRIEVAGKMTEDTLDISIAVTMMGVMASRMYGDYLTIQGEGKHEPVVNANNATRSNQRGHYQQSPVGDFAGSAGYVGAAGGNGGSAGQAVNGSSHSAVSADGWQQLDGKQADDIISRALAQDAGYRASNGLL